MWPQSIVCCRKVSAKADVFAAVAVAMESQLEWQHWITANAEPGDEEVGLVREERRTCTALAANGFCASYYGGVPS